MERKERGQNSEPGKEQQIGVMLGISGKLHGADRGLEIANIEAARFGRNTLIKQNQSEEQNETAKREINCDLPRRRDAIAAAPNSDQQERRDERELVKRVKEKQIDR